MGIEITQQIHIIKKREKNAQTNTHEDEEETKHSSKHENIFHKWDNIVIPQLWSRKLNTEESFSLYLYDCWY